ncbi:AraC family transcriptional regulator N-terminal domain-containing protein, partial [Cloacibacillus evryensis]
MEASPEKPYLGLTLELDLQEISQLMLHDSVATRPERPTDR